MSTVMMATIKMSKKANHIRNGLIDQLLQKCLFYSTRNEVNQAALLDEFTQLSCLANSIKDIEKGLSVQHQRDDYLDEFVKWCGINGLPLDDIAISLINQDTGEYGLVSRSQLPEDKLILTIHKNLMMTTESALKDDTIKACVEEDALLKSMPNLLLTFHLMNEFGNRSSFWRPYILFLPSTYSTPLYWTQEDMIMLKGSPTLLEAVKLCRNIYRQYAYFWKKMTTKNSALSKLGLKSYFSLDLYRWAISTVMTRQNQLPALNNGQQPLSALIPLWDMCNHQEGKFSTDYDPLAKTLVCYAMRDFAIGEEITIFYGNRTNAEFLVNNGFVYPGNQHDHLLIRLGLSKVDPLYDLKAQLCAKIGLISSGYFPLHQKNQGLDESLVNFLKIFSMDKDSIEKFLLQEDKKTFEDISESLEKKVTDFIRIRCQILLKSYPTFGIEEIKSLSNIKKSIAQLIDCEKAILVSHVNE